MTEENISSYRLHTVEYGITYRQHGTGKNHKQYVKPKQSEKKYEREEKNKMNK